MSPVRAFFLLLAFAPADPTLAMAQNSFDGVVTFRSTMSAKDVDTMMQVTKGQKMRLEGMGADGSIMIIDGATGQFTMLDPRQRSGMTMTRAQMAQMQALAAGFTKAAGREPAKPVTPTPASKASFVKSGRTETIAGQRCQVYTGKTVENGKTTEGQLCLADGVGIMFFRMMLDNPITGGSKSAADGLSQFEKLVGPNQGIMKAVSTEGGKSTTNLEVLRIDRGPVSDTAFAIPKGFKVEDMGEKIKEMEAQLAQFKAGGKP